MRNEKAAGKKKRENLYQIFNRDRHTRTMGVILLLTLGILLWQEISWLIPEQVTVSYAGMDGKTKTVTALTRQTTVGAVLKEAKIGASEIDTVHPCREYPVSDKMKITVEECIHTQMEIHGKMKDFTLKSGTVRENLKLNDIRYDKDDRIYPELDSPVRADTKITVDEVHRKVTEGTKKVKSGDKVVLDPGLSSGTVQETGGRDGEGLYTYTTTYINGKKSGTRTKLKKWITKPEDHTLRCGTSETGEKGEVKVKSTFTANTTAYYAGTNAHGSTGQRVHYGTCAVDPSVIPYGTRLYIEGYGIAVANDCGGAVQGHIVDLYMRSTAECIRWGRQNRKAYVLAE